MASGASKVPRSSIDSLLGPVRRLLVDLMRSTALERGDVEQALEQLTEASARALRVERTSVWTFSEDRSRLDCVNLFEAGPSRHTSGAAIHAKERPAYFRALETERVICAETAREDPRTSEFTHDYLVPNGITSMLDAPILLAGKLVGVVCHEHIGPARSWDAWEELAAGTFADFVAMVFGARERVEQAAALATYQTRLEQLVEERTRQLKQSEDAFKQLFEGAPVALTLSRLPDNHVIAANARTAELFELSPDEIVGVYGPDYWLDPQDRQRLVDLVREQGTVSDFEAGMLTKTGKTFWAHIAVRMLTVAEGNALLFGIRDVTAQKVFEDRLRELASMDELTGLLNRRRLLEVSQEEVDRAQRYGRSLCVAMMDLDHFKNVNDRFGHSTGDATLRGVAGGIRDALRKQDRLGRYGGEELMAMFPETEIADAMVVAERMRSAIESLTIDHDGHQVKVTVSVGVVQWRRDETLGSVVRRADAALYEAKANGRNCVVRGPAEG